MKPSPLKNTRLTASRTQPTNRSVVRKLAVRCFCDDPSQSRTLLRKPELAQYFPTLFQAGLPAGYYVDATTDLPVLGHIRVDVGLDEVGRIVSRCHQLARRHWQLHGFRQLISAGQFEITYLVATEMKARRLNAAFGSVMKTGVRCAAESSPILLDLLVPLPANWRKHP